MKELLKEFKDGVEACVFALFYGEVTCRLYWVILVAVLCFIFGMFVMAFDMTDTKKEDTTQNNTVSHTEVVAAKPMSRTMVPETTNNLVETTIPETTSQTEVFSMSQKDIELIALLTMAEAEGECEEGKRLVIDTILNRVDSGYWPDTVNGVVYQANQFSPVWNGRIKRCYVSEEYCQLVKEELNNRTNSEVVFFRTGHYSEYGQPLFQVGNHYFSSYD